MVFACSSVKVLIQPKHCNTLTLKHFLKPNGKA